MELLRRLLLSRSKARSIRTLSIQSALDTKGHKLALHGEIGMKTEPKKNVARMVDDWTLKTLKAGVAAKAVGSTAECDRAQLDRIEAMVQELAAGLTTVLEFLNPDSPNSNSNGSEGEQ